jgi:hypothetical protein
MQPHQWNPILAGKLLGIDALAQPGGRRRTSGDRKILPADGTRPPIDPAGPKDEVGGREGDEPAVLVALGAAGQFTPLGERARIDERLGAFTDGQLSRHATPRERVRISALPRRASDALDLLEPLVPAHAVTPVPPGARAAISSGP